MDGRREKEEGSIDLRVWIALGDDTTTTNFSQYISFLFFFSTL